MLLLLGSVCAPVREAKELCLWISIVGEAIIIGLAIGETATGVELCCSGLAMTLVLDLLCPSCCAYSDVVDRDASVFWPCNLAKAAFCCWSKARLGELGELSFEPLAAGRDCAIELIC